MDLLSISQITSVVLTDYFAVIVGVVMGALYGAKCELDVIGAVTTALLTGFGGGFVRDLMLHDQGIFLMEHSDLILASVCLAALAWSAGRHLSRMDRALVPLDAVSMALFALAGCAKAYQAGVGGVYTVLLGTITAVGGGALASAAIAKRPKVFTPGDFYAVAGLGGSFVYVLASFCGADELVSGVACVAACLLLRWTSLRFNLNTKAPQTK